MPRVSEENQRELIVAGAVAAAGFLLGSLTRRKTKPGCELTVTENVDIDAETMWQVLKDFSAPYIHVGCF